MSSVFLVDNSVVQRLADSRIRGAWNKLIEVGDIATCLPTLLEAGFSARNAADHAAILSFELEAKLMLAPTPEVAETAVALQKALFAIGHGRAVGVSDLQIASTALHYAERLNRRVVVVHYDSDFDHISRIRPEFDAQWIVPRGSVR